MKRFGVVILIIVLSANVLAQEWKKAATILDQRREVYVKINAPKDFNIEHLGKNMSIDKVRTEGNTNEIIAYLNKTQFEQFRKENLDFELLTPPSMLKAATMCADQNSIKNWDCYPTYSQYVALMQSFETDHPDLCQLVEFGQSIDGRKLLALKISDNVASKEEEPEFFYTSTMHGDETTGYALMLRLIDYLLTNYGADSRVTDLVNTTEIWINPLANPDGTYYTSDDDVFGAIRFNSNGIGYDLNRNFPDPAEGENPDNNEYQPENIAMMDFMKSHNFVLSANFHGGVEVINYPWDTWYASEKLHADDLWYQEISREYADTVHDNSTGYMTDFNDGITHGASWYRVSGGRQDYVNYYLHGREVTIEISAVKLLDMSLFNDLWNYNYRSLLNYINRVHKGVYGKVTDQDDNPLHAKISLTSYDTDSSEVYAGISNGMYYRMLSSGNYQLVANLAGYAPAEFNITVPVNSKIEQNIVLQKYPTGLHTYNNSVVRVVKYKNPIMSSLEVDLEIEKACQFQLSLFDIYGKAILQKRIEGVKGLNKIELNVSNIKSGAYICKIHSKLFHTELKIIKIKR